MALNYEIEKISGVEAKTWASADQGDIYEDLDALLQPKPGAADWKSSMAQDVTKGRRTEAAFMNGYIVARGREAGIHTPVNAAIVDVMRGVDSGEINARPV